MVGNLITSKFGDLGFEPIEHKYTLDGQNLIPVSDVVSSFAEEFSDQISIDYAHRYGLNIKDVRASWKQSGDIACDFGHAVHAFGERYYSDKSEQPKNNHEFALVKFWNELPYTIRPIASEARVYTKQYRYAGTFDLLLYDESNDGYIIVDYKTNKDLFKNYKGRLMLSPFDFLLDNPYNHYQLQLSLYQIPLEEIGINIIDRWVIWLKGTGDYSIFKTDNYTEYLKQTLV
jgi:hypothetical protein